MLYALKNDNLIEIFKSEEITAQHREKLKKLSMRHETTAELVLSNPELLSRLINPAGYNIFSSLCLLANTHQKIALLISDPNFIKGWSCCFLMLKILRFFIPMSAYADHCFIFDRRLFKYIV